MPLRKVFVDKEGDDDKKSINDALSWFLQKFTLIHFSGHGELPRLLVGVASVIATSSVVSPVVSGIQTSSLSTSSALLALSALSALLSSLPSLLPSLPTAKVSRPS
jgi:hypothetical protein